ncbi:MAG: hypothetical protein EP330_08030 [Deltaproteobacteria bacterium]|nr:MAG: hypothetical protein EP330_08030 [Deltaproteobacteria bacterium]
MDELPKDEDLIIVPLSIEAALLPDWYDAVVRVAHPLCRRIGVIEKPDEWLVQIQLPKDRVGAFKEGLVAAWEAFVAERKERGDWE